MTGFIEARHKLYKLCADLEISVRADFRSYPMRVTVCIDNDNQTEFRLYKDGNIVMLPHWEDGVPIANHQKIQKAVQDLMLAHALEFFATVKISGKLPDPANEDFDISYNEDEDEE